MINLLPTDTRRDLLYARRNRTLLRWTFALLAGFLGIGLIIVAGLFYLDRTTSEHQDRLGIARVALQSQNIDDTQKKVDEISGNVKLTTQVLSREILFSKLLKQLGSALPANTSLKQLQIDKLQGGLSLSVLAKDINSATQVQLNLQDPRNKIFEKADIETITCDAATAGSQYPCIVQVRALFAKNNPFLYISPTSSGAKQP